MSYIFIKIIALISMFIDHSGYILFPTNIYFRIIGRLAFPLFCFLIVNGYHHTSNKFKYLRNLFIFAFISEFFFDLGFFKVPDFNYQNVFFTLSLGLLTIIIYDYIKSMIDSNLLKFISTFIIVLFFALLSILIKSDYSWFGVLLIFFLNLFYGTSIHNRILMALSLIILNIIYLFVENTWIELFSCFDIIFIFLFKNKFIRIPKFWKYFMYIFYPLHIFILYIVHIFF